MLTSDMTVIAHPDGGLGNRLKCLASAIRLAGGQTEKVHVAKWSLGSRDDAGYDKILDNSFTSAPLLYSLLASRRFRKFSKKLSNRLRAQYLTEVSGWRLSVQENDPVPKDFASVRQFPSPDPDWRHIDFEYARIPQALRKSYADVFSKLEPKPHILETLDSFFQSCGEPQPTVGVHLRTWNDAPERRSVQMLEEAATAMQSLKDNDPEVRFFVSSDEPDTALPYLRDRFGDAILTFDKAFCHPSITTDMEVAWCDMLILSRMSKLIVTKHSTFSETAWWLGGATAEIVAEIGAPKDPVLIDIADQGWKMAYLPNLLEHLDYAASLSKSARRNRDRYTHLMTSSDFGPARSEDVMIDVGANIGLASIPVAIEPLSRRVVAFEPIAKNTRVLAAGLKANDVSPERYEIVEAAAGNPQTEFSTLFIPEKRTDQASLGGASAANWYVKKHAVNSVRVPMTSLDRWYRSSPFAEQISADQIRLIKIGVQGWEERVLRGASELIDACRPHHRLIIEFMADPVLLTACNSKLSSIVGFLESHGMKLYCEDATELTVSRANQQKSSAKIVARFS